MLRAAGAGWVAAWLVLAPLAFDLAHPLLVPCDGPHESAGESHEHPTLLSREVDDATDGSSCVPRAPGCCGERSGPTHRSLACCSHGGCLCCGGVAVAAALLRQDLASAPGRFHAHDVYIPADGVAGAVYRPPRA